MEAVQNAEFREAIASSSNARYIEDQQMLQWHFYIRKRQRLQVNFFAFFKNLNLFKQFSQLMEQLSQTSETNSEAVIKSSASNQIPNLPPPKP